MVRMLNRNRLCALYTEIDSIAVGHTARKINFARLTGNLWYMNGSTFRLVKKILYFIDVDSNIVNISWIVYIDNIYVS